MKAYKAKKIVTPIQIKIGSYLHVKNNKIVSIDKEPKTNNIITKFENQIIAPGYIDIHTHGGIGYGAGYGNTEDLISWSKYKLKHGVTSFLNTTSTMSISNILKACDNTKKAIKESRNIIGLHLEGLFLTKGDKRGAQDSEYILDDVPKEFIDLIKKYSSIIKYATVDPLHNDIKKLANIAKEFNIVLSAGHTEISNESFKNKKHYGFKSITHTFNGMKGLHHRHPGLAYSGCMDDDIYSEIICDGHHISYPMLELFFKLKNTSKIILITDSMMVSGLPAGNKYQVGQKMIYVDPVGKLTVEDGGLAGSTLTMDKAVKNIVQQLKIPLKDAIMMATLNPAKLIGTDEKVGSLEEGKYANFIVIDDDLQVNSVFIKGKNYYMKGR